MLFRYYKTLVAVVRSDREGSAYLYGGEEMGLWCMVTLLRNMPARRESEESCPSQVFREIAKKSSNKCKLFWRKTLMWNCLVWTSAVLGIFCSFVFSFVMRRCTFAKCYRMLLFRPDLIIFASQNNWGRKFGDYFGGDKQFSAVDVSRVYSLVIRSAYHIVDINNKPSQGEVSKTTKKTLTTKHLSDFFLRAAARGQNALPRAWDGEWSPLRAGDRSKGPGARLRRGISSFHQAKKAAVGPRGDEARV